MGVYPTLLTGLIPWFENSIKELQVGYLGRAPAIQKVLILQMRLLARLLMIYLMTCIL